MAATEFSPVTGLIGGALIGLAAVVLMLTIGRIAGICGIALNVISNGDVPARIRNLAFIIGLPLGALLVTALGLKDWSQVSFPVSAPVVMAAGLLVGTGATLGSGCTSGHGICGLARLSKRSIVATCTFMTAAVVTVFVTRHLL